MGRNFAPGEELERGVIHLDTTRNEYVRNNKYGTRIGIERIGMVTMSNKRRGDKRNKIKTTTLLVTEKGLKANNAYDMNEKLQS